MGIASVPAYKAIKVYELIANPNKKKGISKLKKRGKEIILSFFFQVDSVLKNPAKTREEALYMKIKTTKKTSIMKEDFSIQLESALLPFNGLFAVCNKVNDEILGSVLLDGENVCTTFTTDGSTTVTSCRGFIKKWAPRRGPMVLGRDKQGSKVELLCLDENYELLDFYLIPLLKREGQDTVILSQYEKYRDHVRDIIPETWNKRLSTVKPQRGTKEPRL